ncbi:hypothetical protein ACET3Z_028468 [Daucus carota]
MRLISGWNSVTLYGVYLKSFVFLAKLNCAPLLCKFSLLLGLSNSVTSEENSNLSVSGRKYRMKKVFKRTDGVLSVVIDGHKTKKTALDTICDDRPKDEDLHEVLLAIQGSDQATLTHDHIKNLILQGVWLFDQSWNGPWWKYSKSEVY